MKLRKPFRILRNLILFFFISSIGAVIFYRFVPVYVTPLMIIRSVQQLTSGEKVICKHTWVPFNKISPSLPMAVIASEDNRFASHNGFDMIEIKKAMKENETRKKETGRQYHQPANCKKRFSLASIFMDKKRIRSIFYVPDRKMLVERTDYGSLPKLHRNG